MKPFSIFSNIFISISTLTLYQQKHQQRHHKNHLTRTSPTLMLFLYQLGFLDLQGSIYMEIDASWMTQTTSITLRSSWNFQNYLKFPQLYFATLVLALVFFHKNENGYIMPKWHDKLSNLLNLERRWVLALNLIFGLSFFIVNNIFRRG